MKKVVIMIDFSRASYRQFLRGIEHYIHTQEEWEIYLHPPYQRSAKFELHAWLQNNHVDGIISQDSPDQRNFLSLNKPKIVFENERDILPEIITITSDCNSISKMAAEYYTGLGFKNFAYCGFGNLSRSNSTLNAYKKIITSNKKFHFFEHNCSFIYDTITKKNETSEWLKTLPKPLCIFACNDEIAVYILKVCKIAGLRVPEEIAVLGIDNDELFCNLSYPPLSSIKVGFEKAGFEAAEVLNHQMQSNKSVTGRTITAKPQYLSKRQSTDVIAIEDADVIKAVIFIRKNFQKPIQVSDVVNATTCSRRMLELRFKSYLKRSINDEINRLRIEHIKLKLVNTHAPIYKIAETLKYTDPEHFSRYFKNLTSISPLEYRNRYGSI